MPTDDLDPFSGVAKYLQIADILIGEMRAGLWAVGKPIPSRKTLSERFDVAAETARRAQVRLTDLGYVVAQPGIGLVVRPSDRWPEQA